jgi:hypothetical protein
MRPSLSVRRFPIDGALLLLDRGSNSLFAYNDTARHAWDLIEAGGDEGSLVAEFAQTWRISLARTSSRSSPRGGGKTSWSTAVRGDGARRA